uniref:Uncharacterized protein n=1 Tax=Physcomitrium patens TaxID=3218 RepID=A0A2K1IHQ0_PHYPA|nr:hypothetical protein PHYPA_027495 [Physcomitrium patens]
MRWVFRWKLSACVHSNLHLFCWSSGDALCLSLSHTLSLILSAGI